MNVQSYWGGLRTVKNRKVLTFVVGIKYPALNAKPTDQFIMKNDIDPLFLEMNFIYATWYEQVQDICKRFRKELVLENWF